MPAPTHYPVTIKATRARRNGTRQRSPQDLEAFVKCERFVGRDDWDVLHEGLRDDLAVEGIGVMCGQIKKAQGMLEAI